MDIETMNGQLVGMRGDGLIVIARPKAIMTADEAILHAAWLVVMAEGRGATHTFDEVSAAIRDA